MSDTKSESSTEPVIDSSEEELLPKKEGEDFYFENGLMVLTSSFLKRRGYCCSSGCRNCPYGFQ